MSPFLIKPLSTLIFAVSALLLAIGVYFGTEMIRDVLGENKVLKASLARLTAESRIGYARVLEQFHENGELQTRMQFVLTDRDDETRVLAVHEYLIPGDVVHFDALIVTFPPNLVMDGRERSIHLWRRVYGETMAPRDGFPIEPAGEVPVRYRGLLQDYFKFQQEAFWEQIWELSNDPDKLRERNIRAIYGNVIYRKVRPGLIYLFRVNNTGQIVSEIIPELPGFHAN